FAPTRLPNAAARRCPPGRVTISSIRYPALCSARVSAAPSLPGPTIVTTGLPAIAGSITGQSSGVSSHQSAEEIQIVVTAAYGQHIFLLRTAKFRRRLYCSHGKPLE